MESQRAESLNTTAESLLVHLYAYRAKECDLKQEQLETGAVLLGLLDEPEGVCVGGGGLPAHACCTGWGRLPCCLRISQQSRWLGALVSAPFLSTAAVCLAVGCRHHVSGADGRWDHF